MIFINEFLKELNDALETQQYLKVEKIDLKILKVKNFDRVLNNETSFENEIANYYSLLLGLIIRLNIDFEKYISLNTVFILLNENLINNIKFYNSTKEDVFYQIFKYIFIPFFIRNLDDKQAKIVLELLNDNNIVKNFQKITEFALKNKVNSKVDFIKESNFFSLDEIAPEKIEKFQNLAESFRKNITSNSLPSSRKFFEVFSSEKPSKNDEIIEVFNFGKIILHFKNKFDKDFGEQKFKDLASFTKTLIKDKNNENNQILKLNYWFISQTIDKNLLLKEDNYFEVLKEKNDQYLFKDYKQEFFNKLPRIFRKIRSEDYVLNHFDLKEIQKLLRNEYQENSVEKYYLLEGSKASFELYPNYKLKRKIEKIEQAQTILSENNIINYEEFEEFEYEEDDIICEEQYLLSHSDLTKFAIKMIPIKALKEFQENDNLFQDFIEIENIYIEHFSKFNFEKYLKKLNFFDEFENKTANQVIKFFKKQILKKSSKNQTCHKALN